MSVYVVILCDLYQDHFLGVFASRKAADKYVQSQEPEEGERFLVSEELVRNWSVQAGDQVQTLVQLLPLTKSGLR
jgi:hypothetical protein